MLTAKLARLLRSLRRQHRLSINKLARLSGISRRTLARLETGYYSSPRKRTRSEAPDPSGRSQRARLSAHGSRITGHEPRHFSPRTAFKLARLFLPPEELEAALAHLTRTSRAYAFDLGGSPEDYRLLDLLPDFYPAFLFHQAPEEFRREFEQHYSRDYRNALARLIRLPERTLPHRLRAFRVTHDLTLQETAALLGLSKSELHRLERGQRHPSPRARFRILRLLTLPLPELPRSGFPRTDWLRLAQSLLSLPPPPPQEFSDDPDCLHRLRYLWLTSHWSTRQFAKLLGISQPHLIRLLRGDRRPSAAVRRRLEVLTGASLSSGDTDAFLRSVARVLPDRKDRAAGHSAMRSVRRP